MSFRNHCLRAVLVLAGTGPLSPAWAEDPAPAGTPPPAAPPAECRDLDGKLLGAVDCLELEARFATLAKIAEAKSKIEEARAKAAEAERKRLTAERPEPPPPGKLPEGKLPEVALVPPEPGRVLEILGPEARLRWGGGEYRVRAGQRLPGGARIVQVSLEGVTVAQGTRRETLPFVMGGVP